MGMYEVIYLLHSLVLLIIAVLTYYKNTKK